MEIEQVAEMARAVAGLPQAERDFFDGMVADERAAAERQERVAKLQKMGDRMVVHCLLRECTEHADDYYDDAALQMLQEAGFVRGDLKLLREAREALEGVIRLIVDSASNFPGGFDYAELNRLIMQAAKALSEVEAGKS